MTPEVPDESQLILLIPLDGKTKPPTWYYVTRIWEHDAIPGPAWRLTQIDGLTYDVAQFAEGVQCECKDWEYRRANKDPEGCKHIRALRAKGLLGRKG